MAQADGLARQIAELEAVERARLLQLLDVSAGDPQAILDALPIPVWEEDFTAVGEFFEQLRAAGVVDFAAHFAAHPEDVETCAGLVRLVRMNQASLAFFQVADAHELWQRLPDYFLPESWRLFRDELVALARGELRFQCEIPIRAWRGERKLLELSLAVSREAEPPLSRVMVSFIDLTARAEAEHALGEKDATLRLAAESTGMGVYTWDFSAGTCHYSPELLALYGLGPGETLALDEELVPLAVVPADREAFRDAIAANLDPAGDGKFEVEFRAARPDGSVRWLLARGRVSFGGPAGQRRPVRSSGVLLDIDQQKRIEQQLLHSEQRFEQICHDAAEWVWEVDADGLFTYSSGVVERLLGYTPAELVGKVRFYELFHPDVRAELTDGALAAFAAKEPFQHFANLNQHKHGQPVLLETTGSPLFGLDGELLGYRGLDIDITQRNQMLGELQRSEARYRSAVEATQNGFWMVDRHGTIVEVNAAYCALTGYERRDVLGQPVHRFAIYETPETIAARVRQLHERGSASFISRHRRRDGSTVDVAVALSYVPGEDSIASFFTDLTGRKQLEAIEEFLLERGWASGETFFRELALYLADTLGGDYICIDRLDGDGLTAHTVAVYNDGQFEDNVSYTLADTPCGDVVGQRVCLFPAGVCERFPRDEALRALGAESYVGVTLWSAAGEPIGLIAVIGRQALADQALAELVMQLVSVRAAGELERLLAEEEAQSLFELVPDMVAVTSVRGRFLKLNPAWTTTLGHSRDYLLATPIAELLHPDDVSRTRERMQLTATGVPRPPFLNRYRCADGSYRTLEWESRPSPDGSVLYSVARDVTERERLAEVHRRLNRELRAHNECAQAVLRAVDEPTLIEEVCQILCDATGYALAWVGLAERDEARTVRIAGWAGSSSAYLQGLAVAWADTPYGQGPSGTCIRESRTVVCTDMAADPRLALWRERALSFGFRSSLALPLRGHSGAAFGALTLYCDESDGFSDEDVQLLERLADDLAFGLLNLRVRVQRRWELRVEQALNKLFEPLMSPQAEARALADMVLEQAQELTGSTHGYVSIIDQATGANVVQTLTPMLKDAARANLPLIFARGEDGLYPGLWGICLNTRKPFVCNAPASHPGRVGLPAEHVRLEQILMVPVLLGEALVGQIALANPGRDYTDQDAAALEQFARLYSLGIQRLRSDEHLRETEALYHSLVEQLPQAVFRKDRAGAYVFANQRFCEWLGLPVEQLLGADAERLLGAATAAARAEADRRVMATGAPTAGVETLAFPTVGERTLQVSRIPLFDVRGEVVGMQGIYTDITEQQALEEHLRHAQKMDSIGRLAGGVAHDFNNLLQPILGYTDMLIGDLSPDDPRLFELREVRQAGERGRDLTRQLLAFGRRQVLDLRPVDVGDVTRNFWKLLRRTVREDIQFELRCAPQVCTVRADTGQLEQVLMNLVVNAQHAMPDGGSLSIAISELEVPSAGAAAALDLSPGRYAVVAVRDSGCGMDEATRARIFEPFFTTKAKGEGTGLGLATVYGIIQQHGGAIAVDSALGRGSEFRFYLPACDEAAVEMSDANDRQAPPGGSETILVVDDDDHVRGMVCRSLTNAGYTVRSAARGEDGLAVLAEAHGQFDLLVTDVVMPGMNGREFYERACATFGSLRVLYVSGHTDDVLTWRGVSGQARQRLLHKPFDNAALLRAVRELLDQQ